MTTSPAITGNGAPPSRRLDRRLPAAGTWRQDTARPAGRMPALQRHALRSRPSRLSEPVGAGVEHADVGANAVVQPAAHVVAGRPAAGQHFVMAAAAAEVACPARTARLLGVNVAAGQPGVLLCAVDFGDG